MYLVQGEIAQCDPFNPPNAPCPSEFTCQWSLSNQRYQCCGSNPAPTPQRPSDGCPNAQIAFRDADAVRVCSAGAANCPAGYFCQFSSSNNQFQCCGVSGGCPEESVAFVGMSGEPEKCVVGQSNCPRGFACQKSLAGHHVCCTVRKVACESNEVIIEGECHAQVGPGSECLANEQCTGGSVCEDAKCECRPPLKAVGGFCQEEIREFLYFLFFVLNFGPTIQKYCIIENCKKSAICFQNALPIKYFITVCATTKQNLEKPV